MPTNEKIKIHYQIAHSVQVEYYGTQDKILSFFRTIDLWNHGVFSTVGNEHYYLFELPKEFYSFAKSDSFKYAMLRHGIEVAVTRTLF